LIVIKIDWKQKSTIRGAVWLAGGVIGILFYWHGKDPSGVMLVASSVAGGIGVAVKD